MTGWEEKKTVGRERGPCWESEEGPWPTRSQDPMSQDSLWWGEHTDNTSSVEKCFLRRMGMTSMFKVWVCTTLNMAVFLSHYFLRLLWRRWATFPSENFLTPCVIFLTSGSSFLAAVLPEDPWEPSHNLLYIPKQPTEAETSAPTEIS